MKARIESEFDKPATVVWNEVLNSASFDFVIKPLAYVKPHFPEKLPERWEQGQIVVIKPYLFKYIPLPLKTIEMETIDHQSQFLQTREQDAMIKVWDHTISIKDNHSGGCRYSDTIEIKAGILTPVVCLFAKCFFRHRQNRWKQLLAR